jgi:hypothetical protein
MRSFTLIAALSLLTTTTLSAQTPTRRATSHTLAHQPVACAPSLDACPAEGCGGGDPSLNVKKNVLAQPTTQPQEFTFEDFVHL